MGTIEKQSGAQPRLPRLKDDLRWIHTVFSVILGLLIWELVARFLVTDQLFFVPFSSVVQALVADFAQPKFYHDLYVSAVEFVLGFGTASVAGILFGVLMGSIKPVATYLDPWISGLYATPLVALTPFFILVFGIGIESKAALVFSLAVFPVLISTYAGIQAVEKSYIEVADSFMATRSQKTTKVLIPASLPFVISGLRLAAGRSLTAVVVGELFYSSAGIGHMISEATQTFTTANLFAGVVVFAIAGMLSTSLLTRIIHERDASGKLDGSRAQ